MARVLLINPNRWGRGITHVWIPSHSAVLKSRGHEVRLFDCTFYRNWMADEVALSTGLHQYQPTDYASYITPNPQDIFQDLRNCIATFDPDLIFWSALSSHIHAEGEYVNIQYGRELLEGIETRARKIAGGLQPTAQPDRMHERFEGVDCFIAGESEFVLAELADRVDDEGAFLATRGLVHRKDGRAVVNPRQEIIGDMDRIPPYDYSMFDDQVFWRPLNGKVVRAVDYELSRGCVYACSYCVETVIQRYYDFTEINKRGALIGSSNYLRNKSASRVFHEFKTLREQHDVELIRCQDTNFLTIDRDTLNELASLMEDADLDVRLYIETRPEGINRSTVGLLKRLKVAGVGMGLELASEGFREQNLNRFVSQEKIVRAFRLLKEAGINTTSYSIIGLPGEDESMVLESIEFNRLIQPDTIGVVFYSPYLGTQQQVRASEEDYFDEYEYDVDSRMRTLSRSDLLPKPLLEFYMKYFVQLAREGTGELAQLRKQEGL